MPTYKILGQSAPTDTNNADLYSPSGVSAVISSITVTNTSSIAAQAQIYVRKFSGSLAAAATSNALLYNVSIAPTAVNTYTLGVTLAAGDTITVRSGTANALTFQAFGSEI